MFDPQTKARANGKPRILICDGFGTHETLEVLEFCFENNIILCQLPSHTSHKLQPCDIAVFGPLKTAYRDQVERLYRSGVTAVLKKHFTSLYSPARKMAISKKNILAGWAKAGLFPFNPDRVLRSLVKPVASLSLTSLSHEVSSHEALQTPVTPVSSEALSSLLTLIREDLHNERSKQRHQKLVQKLANAAQTSFAQQALDQEHIKFLSKMNNEARSRRKTKSEILGKGKARVMRYEDIEVARAKRAEQKAATEAKDKQKRGRKPKRPATATEKSLEISGWAIAAEDLQAAAVGRTVDEGVPPAKRKRTRWETGEAIVGYAKRSRKCETAIVKPAPTPELQTIDRDRLEERAVTAPYRTPVARMY